MALTADLIPMDTLGQAAALLRVLAHPHRLRVVELLKDDRLSVGELSAALDLPPAAVSQHLSLMKAHRILDSKRDGREVYYRVVNRHALNVINCIRKHGPGTTS